MIDQNSAELDPFELAISHIQKISKAFPEYRKVKLEKRCVFLENFLFSLVNKKAEILDLLCHQEKCPGTVAEREFIESLDYLHFLKTRLLGYLEKRLPMGPALIYGSWSSPLLRFSEKVITALALGNTVLLHCAPEQQRIYQYFIDLALTNHFPADTVTLVASMDPEAIETLYSHPSIRTVNFSGHSYEGDFLKKIPQEARKKYKIHYGGRNPVIFLYDADLSELEDLIKQALEFHYLGEMRFNRWFVQEKIYAEFIEKTKAIVENLNPETQHIPNKLYQAELNVALQELKKERQWLQKDANSAFVSLDFNNCSPLQQQEVVGPVLTITRFKNSTEAVKFVNTTFYANAACVFGSDREKIQDLSQQLTMPLVTHNRIPVRFWEKPLHSLFDSGFGCDVTDADFFTVPKVATLY